MRAADAVTTHETPTQGGPERCPVCRAKILVKSASQVMVHNAILRVEMPSRRVSAKCARCKSWVEVPLRYSG